MNKDLKSVSRRGKFYKHIGVLEHNELENAIRVFPHLYHSFLKKKKKYADKAMKAIYGRPIYFKENETHDTVMSIHDMCQVTGCSTGEIAETINTYVNRRVCYFRDKGDKRVPVELERIKTAFFAVKDNKSIEEIDKILYEDS